ncbi:MAG: CPBP family intramembrane glutamic endopeptidase [Candidatus Acidiferrum sp.]
MKQLGVWATLGIWAGFCLGGALFASWQGYGGRAFAATLTCFAFLLLTTLLLAARSVVDGINAKFGPAAGIFLGVCVLFVYLLYLLGTSAALWWRVGAIAGLIFVPLGMAVWAGSAAIGAWQDFASLLGIWVFVKFGNRVWHLWPYPDGKLAHVMTVLVAVNAALASFMLVRRAKGMGYSLGWGKRWGMYVVGSFVVFACIAIPLGSALHFIAFAPQWSRWSTYAGLSLAILTFTAWPEELLFRGLLQNFLSKASKSELAGWWTASVLFGFSHITNMGFPNWRYVILATIAGLFYGWTWRKTGSIFASALVHGAVDVVWHFLFRTL